ncbi:ATP-dependent Clp protease ATP-binding subunit [bacterium]|nr:ATP-dependent Clp protease ATP-binding subunit [bacterium]
MFDRFSEETKQIFQTARQEATRLNAEYLDSEHLMLAILLESKQTIESIFKQLNISYSLFTDSLLNHIQRKQGRAVQAKTEISFSDSAKQVIAAAFKEASFFQDEHIEVEHLLLAIIQEKKGILGEVLAEFPVSYQRLRALIYQHKMVKITQEQKGKKSEPTLIDSFCRDITQLAREGKLDPVIGREDELERIMQILNRRSKNNPVLLGDAGVGKTAIVEGLAQAIIRKDVPETIINKRLVGLDLAALVAGTKYRGQFEERLQQLLRELTSSRDIILFIDEIHTLVGAGAAEGSFDAANMLKPALSRGEFQCIGATTVTEYRKYIEKDGALERRFQTIQVPEPDQDQTVVILRGLRQKYEEFHGVKIGEDALEASVRLAHLYITDRFLPDKAIDVLDETCARVKLRYTYYNTLPQPVENEYVEITQKQEQDLLTRTSSAPFRASRELPVLDSHTETGLITLPKTEHVVTAEDVAEVVSQWSGVPVTRLKVSDREILLAMEDKLHERVIGQDEAISVVSRSIRRSRAGLRPRSRPMGSFLFLGPSGVGKTELARTLSEFLFADENSLIRVDMSEFMEKHASSRLIGSPPGYVGYEEGGQLTEKVRRRPYSVVLLDEIEKADPTIFNLLLQVLDEGHLTDGLGRRVNFKNTVLIMTSNLGTRLIGKSSNLGFSNSRSDISFTSMKKTIHDEIRNTFTPEFLNRIDEIVIFHRLERAHLEQIFELQIKRFNQQDNPVQVQLVVQETARSWIIDQALHSEAGARPLLSLFRRHVEDPLSERLLAGDFPDNSTVQLVLVDNKPVLELDLPVIQCP